MDKSSEKQLTADFLGVNSLVIRDGKTTLLVDPYFTRVSKPVLMLRKFKSNPKITADALNEAGVKTASAILITHTHMDHVLDAAQAARITGAIVCGSLSTANVCRGENLPEDQIKVIQPGDELEFGDFSVRFVQSKHLVFPKLLSMVFGPGREVTRPLKQPARVWAYAEGGCFALHFKHPLGSFLNTGSANWVPGALDGCKADVGLLGIGGLDLNEPAYWEQWFDETVGPTGLKKIYCTHWDDFAVPLNKPPKDLRKCRTVFEHLKARSEKTEGPSLEMAPWKGRIKLA